MINGSFSRHKLSKGKVKQVSKSELQYPSPLTLPHGSGLIVKNSIAPNPSQTKTRPAKLVSVRHTFLVSWEV